MVNKKVAVGVKKSDEEINMERWLDEAKNAGYVIEYLSQPECFMLSEPERFPYVRNGKAATRELVKGHIYTPDYFVVWAKKAKGVLYFPIDSPYHNIGCYFKAQQYKGGHVSIIEVKGTHDRNNMERLFKVNQKWVLKDWGVYVQMVRVGNKTNTLFSKTWTPKRYLLTERTMKPRKILYPNVITVEEFEKKHNSQCQSA